MKAALNDDMYFKPLGFVYPDDKMAIRVEDQLILGNEIMIAPVYEQNARGRYVYLPEEMKFIKFLPDGTISEEILAKGVQLCRRSTQRSTTLHQKRQMHPARRSGRVRERY